MSEPTAVEALAEALHLTGPRNHNLGEGPARAICTSVSAHNDRAERMLAALPEGWRLSREPRARVGRYTCWETGCTYGSDDRFDAANHPAHPKALTREPEAGVAVLREAASAYIRWRDERMALWQAVIDCKHSNPDCPEMEAVRAEPFDADKKHDDAIRAARADPTLTPTAAAHDERIRADERERVNAYLTTGRGIPPDDLRAATLAHDERVWRERLADPATANRLDNFMNASGYVCELTADSILAALAESE